MGGSPFGLTVLAVKKKKTRVQSLFELAIGAQTSGLQD